LNSFIVLVLPKPWPWQSKGGSGRAEAVIIIRIGTIIRIEVNNGIIATSDTLDTA